MTNQVFEQAQAATSPKTLKMRSFRQSFSQPEQELDDHCLSVGTAEIKPTESITVSNMSLNQ